MRFIVPSVVFISFIAVGIMTSWSILESRERLQSGQLIARKYPGCKLGSGRLKLNKSERQRIKKNARVNFVSSSYNWFRIVCSGHTPVFVLKDSHRVRSKRETILVFIDQKQTVLDVQILDFQEPADYMAPQRWLRLLHGKGMNDTIMPGSDLSAISGATLTSNAISSAVRRALTLQDWLLSKKLSMSF